MRGTTFACLLACLLVCWPVSRAMAAQAMTVREERTVMVQGVKETWRLVWIGEHPTVCGAATLEDSLTCPCSGVAYGEYGNLWLVRLRHGREVERMDLRPLFGQFDYPDDETTKGRATLQRWPVKDRDYDRMQTGNAALTAEIERRPVTVIMNLADYNHDGQATEFLIQVGTLPCGKLQYAAVGLSARRAHLHAFSSAEAPAVPLYMSGWVWQALRKTARSSRVTTWECDDHGSKVHSDMIVSARRGRIHQALEQHDCPVR